MIIAFVLSLLLHGVVILALFDTERSPPEAARSTIVSVHMVASAPAEAPSAAPASPREPSIAPPSGLEEDMRKQGNEPLRVGTASKPPSATPAQSLSSRTAPDTRQRIATRPAPKIPTLSQQPRFAEAPDNRADDSPSTYLRLLAMRLAEVKQYPSAAIARREQGQALLSFRLDRSGRVLSWQIARSSGHDELDAEVARMVERAAPFPPFPAAWHATSASFQVPIGFSLY